MSQPRNALATANARRWAGARVRVAVANGELSLEEALYHEDAGSLWVDLLMRAVPRYGPAKTRKILSAALSRNSRLRVRDLTEREKAAIIAATTRSGTNER